MTYTWPAPVSAFLESLSNANSPAFLQINERLELLSSGGALARYSLDGLEKGSCVTQRFPVLEGVLENHHTDIRFERVQLIKAHYENVDVFSATGCLWVILTDTTVRGQVEQRQQQRRLELALTAEERARK